MITRYTLFYAGLFVAFSILAMVIFNVLELNANSGVSVALAMVTAMLTGQIFAKEQKRPLSKKERHQLAAAFTLAGTLVSVVLLIAVFAVLGEAGQLEYGLERLSDMAGIMAVITVVLLLVQYGISWLGLGLGVKAQLKQQAAKAAKN